MRLLHTADWHLGRLFAGHDLLEAQRHALDGLVAAAADVRPDVIVVAGDLYDRAVPSEDAVGLLDDAFQRLATVAPVAAIAGNHDSGPRLDFGRRLFRGSGVHLAGTSRGGVERVIAGDDHGPVHLHLLPYATPEEARYETGRDDLTSHDDATRARLARVSLDSAARHVLVAHLFAQGGEETPDCERDITVGGLATVGIDAFAAFHYTALGHLHRPHDVGGPRVRYSGSLVRSSFAEATHEKSASVVEIDRGGGVRVEPIPLPALHGMRTLRGTFADLLAAAATDDRRERDLVKVVLTDEVLVPGSRDRLRQLYPFLLEHVSERPVAVARDAAPAPPAATATSPHAYVDGFFADRYRGTADPAVRALARDCMEQALRAEHRP